MADATRAPSHVRTPADGGQLEDEPQPPGGGGPGPEAGLDAAATRSTTTARSRSCVLPPFTDLRSRADARRRRPAARSGTAPRTSPRTTSGAYTGEISGGDAGQARLHLRRGRATPSAASTTPRPTSWSTPRPQAALGAGMTPIVCVGEGLEVRQAGEQVPYTLGPGRRLAGRVHAPSRSPGWWSPTSRCGRSAPARWPRPTTRRRSARRSATRIAEVHGDAAADAVRDPVRRLGEGRERRRDHGEGRRRRLPGRRGEPAGRRVRRDLPVLRHAGAVTVLIRGLPVADSDRPDVGFPTVTLVFTILLIAHQPAA